MSIEEFVSSLFDNSREEVDYIDLITAINDVDNFRREGWELPEDLDPINYMETWNELVYEEKKKWVTESKK